MHQNWKKFYLKITYNQEFLNLVPDFLGFTKKKEYSLIKYTKLQNNLWTFSISVENTPIIWKFKLYAGRFKIDAIKFA